MIDICPFRAGSALAALAQIHYIGVQAPSSEIKRHRADSVTSRTCAGAAASAAATASGASAMAAAAAQASAVSDVSASAAASVRPPGCCRGRQTLTRLRTAAPCVHLASRQQLAFPAYNQMGKAAMALRDLVMPTSTTLYQILIVRRRLHPQALPLLSSLQQSPAPSPTF